MPRTPTKGTSRLGRCPSATNRANTVAVRDLARLPQCHILRTTAAWDASV
jgi:hypothetical protein